MSQKGFTLTELIIAVAIFALMAAIAVPRYAAINTQTRQASIEALASHVNNSARLTNKVWSSAGSPDEIVIEGRIIDIEHGFPTDQSIGSIVVNNGDYLFGDGYWKHKQTGRDERCAVLYIPPAADGGQYQVISYTEGC
ncbi:MAG: type II secretion system GspH family protein [Gammaproteobacteria bacterium]|nr:type II secretion system GspH family protein [Gammaproteobacteria bacterium]